LKRAIGAGIVMIAGIAAALLWTQLPAIGAGGLLQPARRAMTAATPEGCTATEFRSDGLTLRGWTCAPKDSVRGTIVYLHGIADNRGSSAGVIRRFVPRGFRVVAYDSRAHGDSDGAARTVSTRRRTSGA
jgi:pimeloyl-ACP methyl ester carboxylesterase